MRCDTLCNHHLALAIPILTLFYENWESGLVQGGKADQLVVG